MKHEQLHALTRMAVDRAVAAREAAGVELTDEQIANVSGGLHYVRDPSWYGIWEILKNKLPSVDHGVVEIPHDVLAGLDPKVHG